jgi:hypothetical protein
LVQRIGAAPIGWEHAVTLACVIDPVVMISGGQFKFSEAGKPTCSKCLKSDNHQETEIKLEYLL